MALIVEDRLRIDTPCLAGLSLAWEVTLVGTGTEGVLDVDGGVGISV